MTWDAESQHIGFFPLPFFLFFFSLMESKKNYEGDESYLNMPKRV